MRNCRSSAPVFEFHCETGSSMMLVRVFLFPWGVFVDIITCPDQIQNWQAEHS